MEKHIILDNKLDNQKENIGNKVDDFDILQTLGKGAYGYVAKVKSKINKKIYAMKMIDFSLIKNQQEIELTKNEIEIIKNLKSPHIIKFYNCFEEQGKYYILMEFINNGDMKGYILVHQNMNKQIPEAELWELFYQCMSGLVCIHKSNIIHRDIKPANLFLTDNKTIKIGDFGVSANRNKNQNNNQNESVSKPNTKETLSIGTPLYMSPEMFSNQEYGSKVDVYAMGCTFYEMCHYHPPRMPMPVMNPRGEITMQLQDITPKDNNSYSDEVKNLINLMIERDQNNRPHSDKIFQIIKYKYNSFKYQNSSIACAFRCLFTFKEIINCLKKYNINYNDQEIKSKKPISTTFLYAFDNFSNNGNNNSNKILCDIRDILTFQNSNFEDPGEIEPENLINYVIRKIHIEINKAPSHFSRLVTRDEDPDLFDRQKIIQKYQYNFTNDFKSRISDNFFGTMEIVKQCLKCNNPRYYFESFYYLKFDANELMKRFSNSNNFIFDTLNFESQNYTNKDLFCPNCKIQYRHTVKKKIITVSSNLIIALGSEDQNFNTQNLKYPINLSLNNFGIGNYNLKGVIRKTIVNEEKHFECTYLDNNQWILTDGYKTEIAQNPSSSYNNNGNVVMLFYSNKS